MGVNLDFVSNLLLQSLKKKQGDQAPNIPDPLHPGATVMDKYATPAPVVAPAPVAPPVVDPTTAFVGTAPVVAPPVIQPTSPSNIIPDVTPPAIIGNGSSAEQQLQQELGRDYSIEKDENGNVIHRGKDRDKKWSTWDKVLSAISGWATGGLAGGVAAATDRNYFEKMGSQNKIARLAPQVQAEQQIAQRKAQTAATAARPAIARAEIERKVRADKARFDNQTKAMDIQGQRVKDAKERYKVQVDENGLRWKEFTNDPGREKEPIMDPITREQDVDPSFRLYEYTDPTTGQTVPLKGSQLATVGATIAAGNATREQSAATTNANNEIEVMKANITNAFNYSKSLFERATAIAKANGEAQGSLTEVQGLQTALNDAGNRLGSLGERTEENAKEYDAALKEFNGTQEKFYQAVRKTTSGAQAVQQMASQGIQQPGILTAPKVKAVRVGVPSVKVSEQVFRQRLVANGIKDAAQQSAIIAKAKSDGVIQ